MIETTAEALLSAQSSTITPTLHSANAYSHVHD